MSIDCRYFTNGTKTAYTLKHTDTGMVEEFALFANIVSRTNETVTFERYSIFGKRKDKPVTVSIADFEKFYIPMTDELYKEALKGEKIK